MHGGARAGLGPARAGAACSAAFASAGRKSGPSHLHDTHRRHSTAPAPRLAKATSIAAPRVTGGRLQRRRHRQGRIKTKPRRSGNPGFLSKKGAIRNQPCGKRQRGAPPAQGAMPCRSGRRWVRPGCYRKRTIIQGTCVIALKSSTATTGVPCV